MSLFHPKELRWQGHHPSARQPLAIVSETTNAKANPEKKYKTGVNRHHPKPKGTQTGVPHEHNGRTQTGPHNKMDAAPRMVIVHHAGLHRHRVPAATGFIQNGSFGLLKGSRNLVATGDNVTREISEGGGGGSGNQKIVYQKWPDKICRFFPRWSLSSGGGGSKGGVPSFFPRCMAIPTLP